MVDFTARTEIQRISSTHCPHGVLTLARMGVQTVHLGAGIICYQGTREAMLNAGVVTADQLPGRGYVNTKKFTNDLGQLMRVTREGKTGVMVSVHVSWPFAQREIATDLSLHEYERCLNRGLDLIRRIGQKAVEDVA